MMLAEETRVEAARLRELRLGDDLVDAAVDVLAARGAGDGAVEPELHARLLGVRAEHTSHGREAAIDEKERARHERSVGRREEQDASGDFFGRARPLEDGGPGGVLPVLLEGPPQRGGAALVKGRED